MLHEQIETGKRALEAGDPKTALFTFHDVLARADESTLDAFGRAQTWIGECFEALGESDAAETSHALAITTLSGFAPAAEELTLSLKRLRASQNIRADEPDAVVIAKAWKLDAIIKAKEGDVDGVVFATRQATSTIATAFGRDHPRQAEVFSHVAISLAFLDPAGFGPLIVELGSAGLRVAAEGDIASRALCLQARAVERSFSMDFAEAIALCDQGRALTDGSEAHSASATWFKETRTRLEAMAAR